MRIESKEKLLYSSQKAILEVSKMAEINADAKEAYFAVGTAVHWIVDCIDRIPKDIVKLEHEKIFSALRCANNCLKHNITFKEAHKTSGHKYPYKYPYRYGTYYLWLSIDDVIVDEKYKNQKKNYKEELEGGNVLSTLSEVMDYVKEYYE